MPTTKAWVLRSILIVQIVTALRILPQAKNVDVNSQEPDLLKALDDTNTTESKSQDQRRSNYVEKMLLKSFNSDYKALRQSRPKKRQGYRTNIAAEPLLAPTPQKALQAKRDEEELLALTQGAAKSALLTNPYVEKKGRNDYLVIQSDTKDSFVTIIPNHMYYEVEKKCVNWLDACSVRGIRERLLERVESPYK